MQYIIYYLRLESNQNKKNAKNVNRFKNELYISYWLLVVNGSNSYCCTKCPQLFLLGTQYSLIQRDTGRENVHKLKQC